MKTLYFDVDGTVLLEEEMAVKAALRNGAFERAVRAANFEKLVCVGNICAVTQAVEEAAADFDAAGVLIRLCNEAIADAAWFRSAVSFIRDPQNRAASIDMLDNWWYVDDMAEHYLQVCGKPSVYAEQLGVRICAPDPMGDGLDVLEWLGATAL